MTRSQPQPDAEYSSLLDDVATHISDMEASRLQLYRRYLQWSVRWASPLIARLADRETLNAAFATLAPPATWPVRIPFEHTGGVGWLGGSAERRLAAGQRRARRGGIPGIGTMGVVLRPPSQDVEGVGVRIVGNSLEVRLFGEGFLITTYKGVLTIDVERSIPATLAIAMAGRPLDTLVEHPLIAGCGYPVRRATSDDHYITLTASTGIVPFRMPWAYLCGVQA